ncbi:hypothetical protein D3C83_32960 [compost metagenome]
MFPEGAAAASASLIALMFTIAGATASISAEKSGRACGFTLAAVATAGGVATVGGPEAWILGAFGSHPAPSVAMRVAAIKAHVAFAGCIRFPPEGDESS